MEMTTAEENLQRIQDCVLRKAHAGATAAQITSFLIALSAFRHGLSVKFLRSVPLGSCVPGYGRDGSAGELFMVSDAKRKVIFNRTGTNFLSPAVSISVRDKAATKAKLLRAGVQTPAGIAVNAGDVATAQSFVDKNKNGRFVVKPVDGTFAIGVLVDLTADQAVEEIRTTKRERMILEEFIPGTEIRVTVVGDEAVGCYIRHAAFVVGDGLHSLQDLANLKNAKTKQHRPFDTGIIFTEEKLEYLAAQGLAPTDIPRIGQKVVLSKFKNLIHGAEFENATYRLNDSVKKICVRAAQAMGLAVTGMDVVLSDNPAKPGAYVLELNDCPILTTHFYPNIGPSEGMHVYDAIIEHYFPDSKKNMRHTFAVFDYGSILETMKATACDQIALPVLDADYQHFRLNFSVEPVREAVGRLCRMAGGYLVNTENQGEYPFTLDILLSQRARMYLAEDRAMLRSLAPELEAKIHWVDQSHVQNCFAKEFAAVTTRDMSIVA